MISRPAVASRAILALAAALALGAAALASEPKHSASRPADRAALDAVKDRVVAAVDERSPRLVEIADRIWHYAETALLETRSAAALADLAEAEGMRVERGVAGMPTAFIASYGTGRPVIAVLGEYDALPGLSQAVATDRAPLHEGAAGHACGHNLFGTASLAAAVAIKEEIAAGTLRGTVRFYGTPAEEAVGGKTYMVRAGLFDDIDAALAWHPAEAITADTESSQAMVDFKVAFHGRAAHAAYDPWNGRSALDAAELFTHALNMLREHVQPTVRIHYVISRGGDVPNVVPELAEVWCWIRDNDHDSVARLLERARRVTEGVALASDVEGRITVLTGDWEMLVNMAGARLIQANFERLGPIVFTDEEHQLARDLQRAVGAEPKGLLGAVTSFDDHPGAAEGGSTDVANVSWVTPTLHLSVTTSAAGVPWHGWPVVVTSGTSIGHKGMVYAAKALALTMADLFADPDALAEVRREFDQQTRDITYRSLLPDGPPPLPEVAESPDSQADPGKD